MKRVGLLLAIAVPALAALCLGLGALEWIRWTPGTAVFFIAIAVLLLAMTTWELLSPGDERRGWLPMPTTRGDRLFIGLIAGALVHMLWLGVIAAVELAWSAWPASAIAAALMVLVMWRG